MSTQLPKFRGFRSTSINLPSTSTTGAVSISKAPELPAQKKEGFFTSAVKGLVKPAVDYAAFVGEAALQGGRALIDPTMRKAVFSPNKMTEDDYIKLGQKKGSFLVDEDKIKDRGTIAKTGLKRTAGAATYAIPGSIGAKGLAGVALSGAATGGLYGLYEGEDIDPARIFTNAATGAVAAPLMYAGGQAIGKAGSKIKDKFFKNNLIKKAGEKLSQEADDYAIKSTRISTARQNKFKQATGKDISEFIKENNLYGQDTEAVQALIDPLQKARSTAVKGGNKVVNPTEIIDDFNRQIKQLSTGSNALDPSNLRRASALKEARDQFASEAVRYAQEIGDESISQYPLAFLDDARASIDRNTPASQFLTNPEQAGNQRAIGSVYRDRVNTTAGTKETGIKLRDLYQFRDALEAAPKGKNTLPFGLNKGLYGTLGSVAAKGEKVPFVGGLIGMGAESLVNNPRNIGMMSKGMAKVGNTLQKGVNLPKINVPNIIPPNTMRNAGLNAINAGVNNVTRSPDQISSRQSVVQAIVQQGLTDPEQIAQMINEAAQRQGLNPDFTAQEVMQYIGSNQNSAMPKFRGFRNQMQ